LDGFERRRKRKKESIRRAALELFKIHGIKKVSIAEIAEKAHVSPATIYNHFTDKNGLACDVIKQIVMDKYNKYRDIINSDKPFPEKIRMITLDKMTMVNDYDEELIEKYVFSSPELEGFINKVYQDDVKKNWEKIFREGKEQGYIDEKLSNEALFLYLDIIRKGTDAHMDIFKETKKNMKIIKELNNLFSYGLYKKEIKLD
jgi:AcrR family transcriptional regulator